MKTLVVIPARLASTRFPGKPLALLENKPIVQWVFEAASKAQLPHKVVIATDHSSIRDAVAEFGGTALITEPDHPSGTDRCSEIARRLPQYEYIINVQGDEPFIQPEQIDQLAELIRKGDYPIATLAVPFSQTEALFNASTVKVVATTDDRALYFSRQPIPFFRDEPGEIWLSKHTYYRHIGMYAYRRSTLLELSRLSESGLEKAEKLEQLRWLEAGYSIALGYTPSASIGIDTPEDLQKAHHWLKQSSPPEKPGQHQADDDRDD